jgi:hypothetical protein
MDKLRKELFDAHYQKALASFMVLHHDDALRLLEAMMDCRPNVYDAFVERTLNGREELSRP